MARWWLGTHGQDLLGIIIFVAGYRLSRWLVWRRWLRDVSVVGPDS